MHAIGARVFVYGSLLAGEENHGLLARARPLGRARTEPRFRLVDLGPYAAMLPGGQTSVLGEVYEVDGETLAVLDDLEDHPNLYRRTEVPLDDGTTAHAYLLVGAPGEGAVEITSGDFRKRHAPKADDDGQE